MSDTQLIRVTDVQYKAPSDAAAWQTQEQLEVYLYGRSEDGSRVVKTVHGTEPYLFVPQDEFSRYDIQDNPVLNDVVVRYEGGHNTPLTSYESYDGKELVKIVVEEPGDVPDVRNCYEDTYESDIVYERRCTADYDMTGYVEVPTQNEIDVSDIDAVDDPETTIEPRGMMIDIEVREPDEFYEGFAEDAPTEVTAITAYDYYDDAYVLFCLDETLQVQPGDIRGYIQDNWQAATDGDGELTDAARRAMNADIQFKRFGAEEQLLQAFVNYVTDRRPDYVSGWNYVDFDHKYLVNRMLDNYGDSISIHDLAEKLYVGGSYNPVDFVPGLPAIDLMTGYCFSGDTDVMTPDGQRNITQLEEGDPVYTLNEDTHEVEIKPVDETHETHNEFGVLETHSGRSHDFAVTPNHRFYTPKQSGDLRSELSPDDYDYTEYRELTETRHNLPEHEPRVGERQDVFDLASDVESDYVLYPSRPHIERLLESDLYEDMKWTRGSAENILPESGEVTKYIVSQDVYESRTSDLQEVADHVLLKEGPGVNELPTEYDMDNWLELMGWYISEGSIRDDRECIDIWQEIDKHRADIRELLNEMDMPYRESDDCFTVNGRLVARWMDEHCGNGSGNKTIPEWVFDLSVDQRERLLQTLIDGDGTRPEHGTSVVYSTLSDRLKDDVMALGLGIGYRPQVKDQDGCNVISLSKQGGSFNKSDGETVEHDETVYCITATDNHTIMAGRNGTFSWVGQCDKLSRTDWESRSLEYVASESLGVGKITGGDNSYSQNRTKYMAYNIVDVQLCVELDTDRSVTGFLYSLAETCAIPPRSVGSEMKEVDGSLFANRKDDEILPDRHDETLDTISGGFVMPASEGNQEWISVTDLKSLYPSSMITCNISRETMTTDPDKADIVVPDMPLNYSEVPGAEITHQDINWELGEGSCVGFDLDQQGILPKYVKLLFGKRSREKQLRSEHEPGTPEYEKYDQQQFATKVLMNSFFGVADHEYFRLSKDGLGAAITGISRYVSWMGIQSIEAEGYDVRYGDTDSLFFSVSDGIEGDTEQERAETAVAISDRVTETVNDQLDAVANMIGMPDQHPYLNGELHGTARHLWVYENEKLYRRFFQHGKKKKYAGKILWKEGQWMDGGKTDITGYQSRKSDSAGVTEQIQVEFLERVLDGQSFAEITDYVQTIIESIEGVEYPMDQIAFPKTLTKDPQEYPNLPKKRACQYSNTHLGGDWRAGEDPWLVYVDTTRTGLPETDEIALSWGRESLPQGFEIDVDEHVRKSIYNPLKGIVGSLPYDWSELKTGRREQSITGSSSGRKPIF